MFKKISVIIPAFNCAGTLSEALDSVLEQDYYDFEIIIIDDGSTDNTAEIAKYYQSRFPGKIRYLYQENHGVSSARNLGLSKVEGEYICFLDSDDFLESKKSLLKRADFLEKYPKVDVVFSNMGVLNCADDDKSLWIDSNLFLGHFKGLIADSDRRNYILNEGFYREYFSFSPFPICTQTIMFRKNILDDRAFSENLCVGEDLYFWFSLIRDRKIGYIDEPLACYRKYLSSLTKNTERYYQDNIKLFSWLLSEESEGAIKRDLIRHLANSYFELSYWYRKNASRTMALECALKSIVLNPFVFKHFHNFFASWLG